MDTQRVMVRGPGQAVLECYSPPRPGPDDVLVQVEACGICGTDINYIALGGMPMQEGGMALGHELAGTVVEAGSAVRDIKPGDRVVVNPMAGGNAIGNGGPEGGFARWLLVRNASRDRCLYPLPASLSFEQGALVEPLGVAMHAVNQAGVTAGAKVVVFGAGPIGLGVIAVLRHRGINDVIAVDVSDYRLGLAMQLGARAALQADTELWPAIAREHGSHSLHGQKVVGTDAYIDAAGVGANVRGVFEHARFGATLVVVALHQVETALPLFQIMAKELVIKGSMAYPDEFDEVLELLEAGRVDVQPMISHRFPLMAFDEALAMARRADQAAKVLVMPSD